jgi:hypothetical protein
MRIAVDLNKFTTLSAFNLWGAITPPTMAFHPDDVPFLFGVTYQVWGTVLTLAAYGFILVRYARRPTTQTLLWAALAIMLTLYVLPTRIHERYMLPALILAALPAVTDHWYRRLFLVMSVTYLVNLLLIYTAPDPPAILDGARTSEVFWRVFSLANVAVLAVMLYRGPWSARTQHDLEPPEPEDQTPEDAPFAGPRASPRRSATTRECLSVGPTIARAIAVAALCAVIAYWFTPLEDASATPPNDTSSGDYFLAFNLLGPALIGLLLTIGRSVSTYVLVALAGAWALAAVGATDSELTNHDNAPGVMLVLGFVICFMAALPGILVVGVARIGLALLRR